MGVGSLVSPDEASFFLNIAVIGGTLLGLTFIALSFFLVDLPKRYEGVALPVFRHLDPSNAIEMSRKKHPYASLTDQELLDGDPLVVFIAYSVAVTWNLFLLPLAVGLTAAWAGVRLGVLAVEMCLFFGLLTLSFRMRNIKIAALRPYLTREELLWPYVGAIGLFLYATATGVVLIAALSEVLPVVEGLAVWTQWGISNAQAAIFLIKLICIVALLLGTYTANKDMFIFFKTVTAEKMRQRWLNLFVQETYPPLKDRVECVKSQIPAVAHANHQLLLLWGDGCPQTLSTHDEFRKAGRPFVQSLWRELINGRSGAASWMLDIPRIAEWAARIEESLDLYASETNTQGDVKVAPPVSRE